MGTLVLLGAGASIEAGVSASTEMSQRIAEAIDTPQDAYRGITHALNYASGALIAHQAAAGRSPYAGIDVEQLFAAVQSLGSRSTVEVAPFVSWSPVLDDIGRARSVSGLFDKRFRESIVGTRYGASHYTPSKLIKEAVEAYGGRRDSEATFRELEQRMLSSLQSLVAVDADRIAYLQPLLNINASPIEIASLNYDRAIELLAERGGRSVDTGIAGWDGAHGWQWASGVDVRLLTLHGSIDWVLSSRIGAGGMRESHVEEYREGRETAWRDSPGIVFGARGKVRAEGPFLAMLREFDEMLARSTRLVVVGYSFRDDHINVAITRWINVQGGRKLTVIDPGFGADPRNVRGEGSYPAQLERAARAPDQKVKTPLELIDLEVIREPAGVGLSQVFGAA